MEKIKVAGVTHLPCPGCYTGSVVENFSEQAWPHGLRLFYLGEFMGRGIGFGGDGMGDFQVFKTYKERGEWVELRFMSTAVERGFKVSRPWGDSSSYDVGVESGSRILRVQVKSTSCRTQFGYLCQFKPGPGTAQYTLAEVDFFAAYVIPKDVWYLIPATVLLGEPRKKAMTLLPENPRHPERYRYEGYREAWGLLCKGKQSLSAKYLK